ncbi:unnamed protein product [Blepharisma stoltei]|uniref:Uncharacterized protein n=1 Tax=Blepharisma stoltei TaxID=1481888 RepID=A0AAU9K7T8_9CILI|nr:unnamed protein product [Blepharisma stoltei]
MLIITETREIDFEPKIKLIYNQYVNGAMLFVTQVNKFGTFIQAYAENPEEPPERRVFTIETKFGERTDEWLDVLARGIVEKLNITVPLMLAISMVTRTHEAYNTILREVETL